MQPADFDCTSTWLSELARGVTASMLDSITAAMKYALLVTALLASVTVAAGRQPQFKSGVEVVYLDVTVQAPDGSIVRGLAKDDFLIYD